MSNLTNIQTVSVPSVGKLSLAAEPGTFTPSGKKRTHKEGRTAEDGGFTTSETPAKLELNINLQPGIDIDVLNAVEDEDVTVRLSTGVVYLMPRAHVQDAVPIGNGDAKVTFVSNKSERL